MAWFLLIFSFGIFLFSSCWAGCGWLPQDLNGLISVNSGFFLEYLEESFTNDSRIAYKNLIGKVTCNCIIWFIHL